MNIQDHISRGQALLHEKKMRYNYWLLTDQELPSHKDFCDACESFDTFAKTQNFPTLHEISMSMAIHD